MCSSDSRIDNQAVVRKRDAGRQPCTGRRVRQIVAHVREKRAPRTNAGRRLKRVADREMRWMRPVSQRVDHQRVEAGYEWPRLVWNRTTVGQVREGANPVSEDRPLPVHQGDRYKLLVAERKSACQWERHELRETASDGSMPVEDVGEHAPDRPDRFGIAVTRNGPALKNIEAAHLVQTKHVIGVRMREQDGVDPPHVERQRLRPQIWPRIHEDTRTVIQLEKNGRPPSSVAGIVRTTGGALASDHGHAVRRACTEKGYLHEQRFKSVT